LGNPNGLIDSKLLLCYRSLLRKNGSPAFGWLFSGLIIPQRDMNRQLERVIAGNLPNEGDVCPSGTSFPEKP
jgi:hypothetical protein